MPQPPPDAIARFLDAHAADAEAWQAFVFEIESESESESGIESSRSGVQRRLLGHRIVRRHRVSVEAASELAARLGRDTSYIDGYYGCGGHPVGYRLVRGAATLDFTVDCGGLSFGDDAGHAAMLSRDMMEFLSRCAAT